MSGYPLFHANTHGGQNARDVDMYNERNRNAETYAATPSGCGNASAWHSAAEFVGLIPKGNFGNSPEGGCAIDTQSQLLFGDPGSARLKGPKQVFQRPFATTPFLGMGTIEGIDDQSRVMFGHNTANRKSIATVTDKPFPVFEPLIPEKQADIPENNYFVEPFLRGGMASRLIPRQRIDLTK
jgi:hypothetical protein